MTPEEFGKAVFAEVFPGTTPLLRGKSPFNPFLFGLKGIGTEDYWHLQFTSVEPAPEESIRDFGQQIKQLQKDVQELKQTNKLMQELVTELSEQLKERPVTSVATLYGLGEGALGLKAPLNVILEDYEVEVVARIPELELHGEGASEPEAINQLKRRFVVLYEDLSNAKAETLGKLPKQWLKLMREMVEARE